MANRSERRAQRRSASTRTTSTRRQARYQILVLIAIVGLVLLAVASSGLVTGAPTPSWPDGARWHRMVVVRTLISQGNASRLGS